jgi:hypothetical protein
MTTKDVLALALEALEKCAEVMNKAADRTTKDALVANALYAQAELTTDAITAIKQAQQAITPETGNAATPEASAITAGNGQAQEPVDACEVLSTVMHFIPETEPELMEDVSALCHRLRAAPKQAEPTGKQSLQVPNGYKLVPVEPTPEILDAICHAKNQTRYGRGALMRGDELASIYRAMLAAAPTPPEAKQ